VWFRFSNQLVEGEEISPAQRAVLASDFSNGLSRFADGDDWLFMNSDLSVHLARLPEGEWIALDGESIWNRDGRGVATSHLFDRSGPIGRATQTLFIDKPLR
jgi:acyl-CoA thioesterase